MAEKNINARVQHKHDVEANWLKASSFVPKQGEIVVYDVDSTHTYERIKIGDGTTVVGSLPFVNDEIRQALTSGTTKVSKAETADRATTADSATNAQTAQTAVSAQTANSATIADTALVANSATKATQDGNGKVIADTYETKTDAAAKLKEAKDYTDLLTDDLGDNFRMIIQQMYNDGQDIPEGAESLPSIRSIAEDAAPQADWNENDSTFGAYIKNRTHWVERGNELKWNGNTDGLTKFSPGNLDGEYYKISELTPTTQDLIGGRYSVYGMGTYAIKAEKVVTTQLANIDVHIVQFENDSSNVIIVITDNYNNDGFAFEKGTYFFYATGMGYYVSSLVCNTDVFGQSKVHGIDPKFLPEGGFGYEESTVLFDQRVEFVELDGMMAWGGTFPETIEVGKTYTVTYNGIDYSCVAYFDGDETAFLGNLSVAGDDDTGEPFIICVNWEAIDNVAQDVPSITIIDLNGDHSATVKIEKSVIHTIDPKFIPEGVGGEPIIVRDSAAASGIALAEQAAPTATMNAAEIMEAVNAGKTVYFLDENRADPRLLPFKEAYRIDELTTGIMPAVAIPDPYVLFGRTNEVGFEGIKVSLTGEYQDVYAEFSNDRNITDISVSGQTLTYIKGNGNTYSIKTQGAQSDWAQTDETAEDFIKNKPDEDDAFTLLLEMNLIEPVTNEDGSIYTNENGAMYTIV